MMNMDKQMDMNGLSFLTSIGKMVISWIFMVLMDFMRISPGFDGEILWNMVIYIYIYIYIYMYIMIYPIISQYLYCLIRSYKV